MVEPRRRRASLGSASLALMDLYQFIADVPDFPEPGIVFKDITPLLAHPKAFLEAVDRMAHAHSWVRVSRSLLASSHEDSSSPVRSPNGSAPASDSSANPASFHAKPCR